MNRYRSLALSLLLGGVVGAPVGAQVFAMQGPEGAAALRKGFEAPPPAARLRCYWWWLNGNTNEATITSDLEGMAAKGYGGALLVDADGSNQEGNRQVAAGPEFGSPAWVKLYVHALREAKRLGLEISLNITSGWNLGGPGVKPEDGSKILTWTRQTAVDGGEQVLQTPAAQNGFYRQIAVLAYPLKHGAALAGRDSGRAAIQNLRFKTASSETGFSMEDRHLLSDVPAVPGEQDTEPTQVVDVSGKLGADGVLRWSPPAGTGAWEILRIGYTDSDARVSTASGAWQGLAIDYMDHEAFDRYWSAVVEPLMAVSKPYLGTSLKYLVSDSWELGGTNWTGRFRTEFQARRGYDPVPYLPVVAGRIVGTRELSDRFLADLRRTVGDLIVAEHYDVFAARAKAYGLGIHPESGGPHGAPLDALETWRHAAFPQSEYWAESAHRATDPQRFFTKEAASAANIYGLPYVAQEGMTSIGPQWSESLALDLKPSFDQAITEGMNRLIWHEFASSPASAGLPGNEYFAGTHLNPQVTWWAQAGDFLKYLNRCQFLMQQGYAVSDVLYYYGDQVPNFVRLKADDPAKALPGFDYDVTNEDALLHSLRFSGGAVSTPAGNRYAAVVLPTTRNLTLPVLEKITAYVHEGGVLIGMPPTGGTGIVNPKVAGRGADLIRQLFGACGAEASTEAHVVEKGLVVCTGDSHAALTALGVREDFSSQPLAPLAGDRPLDFAHRRTREGDVYFVRNPNGHAVKQRATFRASGSVPQVWDPVSGTVRGVAAHYEAATTTVSLEMPAFGAVFVMFLRGAESPSLFRDLADVPVALGPQWAVSFEPGRGAPAATTMTELTDWAKNADPGIRYFSGTAVYRNEFSLGSAPAGSLTVALSELHEIATVRVNGQEAGTIWAPPYRLAVPASLLRTGSNTIELEVTNLWPNRIIGDLQPGVTAPYTRTNIRAYTARSPLLASGVIGRVSLTMEDASPGNTPSH
jgi:hypothetical protein